MRGDSAGAGWKASGYVVTRPNGSPTERATLTRRFNTLLRRTTLRCIRFHGLRHSAAALLLEQGAELGVFKELLSHAHIGATAGVYAHSCRIAYRIKFPNNEIQGPANILHHVRLRKCPDPFQSGERGQGIYQAAGI
ncbi:tyrosine-type recombinase/integrase [Streptomyces sp. cg2]|uniref:tyrosine-type recombinase/integrase n=1 Tax=Streptomyces sp. cg2 TaxID=3238799 RepID=UPI0034E22B61